MELQWRDLLHDTLWMIAEIKLLEKEKQKENKTK